MAGHKTQCHGWLDTEDCQMLNRVERTTADYLKLADFPLGCATTEISIICVVPILYDALRSSSTHGKESR